MLEFLQDSVGEREDALMEMSFYVPRENLQYPGDEETPPSKVHHPKTETDSGTGRSNESLHCAKPFCILAMREGSLTMIRFCL